MFNFEDYAIQSYMCLKHGSSAPVRHIAYSIVYTAYISYDYMINVLTVQQLFIVM